MLHLLFLLLFCRLLLLAQEPPNIPSTGDWIELESREWIGGTLKALYREKVEFNSYTLGALSLPLKRVRRLITRQNVTLNAHISSNAQTWYERLLGYTHEYHGMLDLSDTEAIIQTPQTRHSVARKQIVSVAPYKRLEMEYWHAKATAGLDLRNGNTDATGFNTIAWLFRRSATSRLRFDYTGMISEQNGRETVNNHRLKQKLDLYMTHSLYATPLTSELLIDRYQNIDYRWRLGAGFGATLYNNGQREWDLSAGPAIITTKYHTVEADNALYRRSWALQIDSLVLTKLDFDITARLDYRLTLMDSASGEYSHYLLHQFSRRLIGNIDLDLSFAWNYLHRPIAASDGTRPKNSDFQLLVGVGVGL